MGIVLVGFLCTLLAVGLIYTVGLFAFSMILDALYPAASHGGGAGIIIAPGTRTRARFGARTGSAKSAVVVCLPPRPTGSSGQGRLGLSRPAC